MFDLIIFQVSVIAMEYSKVLFWDRSDLIRTIITDSFFNAIFDHILGRDVVNKLTQVYYSDMNM